MDSKSWLTYQLESMKKATQEEVLENILFPDFSKSRSLSAYWSSLYYIFILLHFLLRCVSQADRPPWPPRILRAQSWGEHPLALRATVGRSGGPLTITLPTLLPSRHLGWSIPWSSSLLPGKALDSFVRQHQQHGTHGLLLRGCFLLLWQPGQVDSLQQLLTAWGYCSPCQSLFMLLGQPLAVSSLLHTHQGLEGKPPSSCWKVAFLPSPPCVKALSAHTVTVLAEYYNYRHIILLCTAQVT